MARALAGARLLAGAFLVLGTVATFLFTWSRPSGPIWLAPALPGLERLVRSSRRELLAPPAR